MLKFMENFHLYNTVGQSLADSNANFNTQWITHGTAASIISAGFHADANSLTLPRTGSQYAQAERRFTSTEDTVIVGYAFRSTSRGAVTFAVSDGSSNIVEIEWPKQFQIGSTLGTATILLNKVYFVELKMVKSTKAVTLKVNGFDYLTTTITDTIPDTIQCFWGFPATGDSADFVFSDVYFVDSESGKFTDFLNPHQVTSRLIDASVDPGWSPNPDTKTRVDIMTNIPAIASEYTEADTVGDKDLYTSSTPVDSQATVNAIAVTSLLTKTDIDDQYVALEINDGSTDKLGSDISVPVQPAYFQSVFETDVSDANWTPATVQSTSFGPVIRPRT